jgi:hypothetical protein
MLPKSRASHDTHKFTTNTDPEVVWTKLKVVKSCHVFTIELGGHPATKGINWQGVIPDETNLDFGISKQNRIFLRGVSEFRIHKKLYCQTVRLQNRIGR